MANPKQRHTRHRQARARKQYDVSLVNTQECSRCHAPVLPHRVCVNCGTYKGKEVVSVSVQKVRSDKK